MISLLLRIAIFVSILWIPWSVRAQDLDKAFEMRYDNPDSAIFICTKYILESHGSLVEMGRANHIIGLANWIKGEYNEALKFYGEAARIRQQKGDSLGYAGTLNGIGLVYWKMRLHTNAINAYLHSLSIAEAEGDSLLMAKVLGNIGILHEEQNNLTDALSYHSRSLEIAELKNDQSTMANGYNNVGIIYRRLGKYEKAIQYLEKSLKSESTRSNDYGRALTLSNIGLVYNNQKLYGLADQYFYQSLEIYTALNNASGMAMCFGNLAANELSLSKPKEAIELAKKALIFSEQSGNLTYLANAHQTLATAHADLGKAKESAIHFKQYIVLQDSLLRFENNGKVLVVQQQYEYNRRQLQEKLDRETERAASKAEIERQVLIRNGIFGIGVLAVGVLILQYRNYLRKKRDNELLELKNEEILRQKQEITDSIIYAKRLQDARLPSQRLLQSRFSEVSVFYRPKDIVSGDFYWSEKSGSTILFAVADCTGHGVPGAMVSMVASEGLNEAVIKQKLTDPAEILTFLDSHMRSAFNAESSEVKDGLDIALFALRNSQLRYSGANLPMRIFSATGFLALGPPKAESDMLKLYEFKGDRRSIGGQSGQIPFTVLSLELNSDDRIVLCTDGMQDQFGGPDGKKLGSARLRAGILEALSAQRTEEISTFFDQWRNREDQVDDVTLVVVKP